MQHRRHRPRSRRRRSLAAARPARRGAPGLAGLARARTATRSSSETGPAASEWPAGGPAARVEGHAAWARASRASPWRATGSTRWATATARSTCSRSARQDGTLVWKARVGPVWNDEYGGPRGTPTVDGELRLRDRHRGRPGVPRGGDRQGALAHEPADATSAGSMMSMWKWSESPLVDGDRVIVTPGAPDAALVALDKATGKEIWRSRRCPTSGPTGKDGAGYSSVVISNAAGVKQYVQLLGRGLVGVRASDGKFLWGYNRVANEVANISTPLVRANWVFASTGYQTGAALVELSKSGGRASRRSELYFLARQDVPEPPRRHGARGQPRLRRATATARASRSASSSRPARSPGAATSATPARAPRPWCTPTATSTSATRTAS